MNRSHRFPNQQVLNSSQKSNFPNCGFNFPKVIMIGKFEVKRGFRGKDADASSDKGKWGICLAFSFLN
jgi:hypothetical protein